MSRPRKFGPPPNCEDCGRPIEGGATRVRCNICSWKQGRAAVEQALDPERVELRKKRRQELDRERRRRQESPQRAILR